MALACTGITAQMCKASYHNYQEISFEKILFSAELSTEVALCDVINHYKEKGKNVLLVSFDCSWFHVRNAHQASGEMIYDGTDVKRYPRKPVISFYVVEKPRKIKDGNNEKIIKEGNFDLSSCQMEHAILIGLLGKLTPVLEKYDMLLNVTIDGDLDLNKTLGNVAVVNQIFADLKHVTKNIRKNLSIKKSHNKNCFIQEKDIRHIQTKEPTLKSYSLQQRQNFKSMLETVFRLPINQGIGTITRTSQNEAFNRVKLVYLDKKIDYWKSYSVRHSLAILHNNEGICEMVNIVCTAYNATLSNQDLENISKIETERNQQHLDTIDWSQELIPYGKKTQYNIDTNQFYPSFGLLIPDFDETTKCIACHAFPKCTAKNLCRICRFYIENRIWNQIIDKNYNFQIEKPTNISFETMCKSALHGIYQYSEFRNRQLEAIQKFIQNNDTIIIKQTGGGKSLCYTLASLLSKGITIVFSPLKALIDDQVIELIKIGVPCDGLYASTEQPAIYQKKVFEEIACGMIRILFTTPEKFQLNIGFRSMLQKYGISNSIRFIINETHCILNQENFCKSWAYLKNLKKFFPNAPILLLTATCQVNDLQEIITKLNINYQQVSLIHDTFFETNNIIYEVKKKKENREKFLENIINIYNEIEIGKCIIYYSSIKSCEDIFIKLQTKISNKIIALYHSELSSKQKSNILLNWKSGKLRIMVATTAFGMGINVSDVRVVIHAGIPMSILQESRHADEQPSFNTTESNEDMESIKRIKYLSQAKQKIRKILFYCSSIYQCRKKAIIEYFAWPEDSIPTRVPQKRSESRIGSGLHSKQKIRKILFYCSSIYQCRKKAIIEYFAWPEDSIPTRVPQKRSESRIGSGLHYVERILEIIKSITSEKQQVTRNNIIDIFRQSQAKEVKNQFGELPVYLKNYSRKLKTKEDSFLLLDDMILRNLVIEDIILTKLPTTQILTCSIFILGITDEAFLKVKSEK
ncbi:hypothetical protein Glove_83g55 [Diversispora epigaea]|uniref:DNA 3'-5' helicase n=1 Tax=Diversispora epigaea TaxID=1348612 RepID=A0A397JBY1_9GLOM|nr:hypothetical protein Glove_83g55 [Diversispora epigaea]